MHRLRTFGARILGSISKRRRDERLDDEIRAHLEQLAAEHTRRGLSRAEAYAAARRDFGGVDQIKETYRDQRGLPIVDSLVQDVRYTLRSLRRAPGFTTASLLILALGIGATTAIFSILDAVVFRALPYRDASRLVALFETAPKFGRIPIAGLHFDEWKTHARSFESLAIVGGEPAILTGVGDPARVPLGRVSPGLFPMLGVRPRLGRLFVDGDDVAGRERVIVMTDALWRGRFGADGRIVGRVITLNDQPFEVVGVLPANFRFPTIDRLSAMPYFFERPQLWMPFVLREGERTENDFAAIGRLRPDATRAQALAELATVQAAIVRREPEWTGLGADAEPLREQITSTSRAGLELLWAAVAAVLIIGCVNVANLLLARVTARDREMAIRAALGAGGRRLIRQIVVETLVLALLGGAAGVALAFLAVPLLVAVAPAGVPRLDEVHVDSRVLLFAFSISTVAGLVTGLVPSRRIAGIDISAAMQRDSPTPAFRRQALGSILVSGQVAISVASIVAAGLLLQSLRSVLSVDRGFAAARLVTVDLAAPPGRYGSRDMRAALVDSLDAQLARIPGVTAVGVANKMPLSGIGVNSIVVANDKPMPPQQRPLGDIRTVSPDYFRALGVNLRQGRTFDDRDRTRHVVAISMEAARRVWPGENALGKRFHLTASEFEYEVIGIVNDVRGVSLDAAPTLTIYLPHWDGFLNNLSVAIKTSLDTGAASTAMTSVVRRIDPNIALTAFSTMDDRVNESVSERRFDATLMLVFAAASIVLVMLGIYGVVSYRVVQRTREVGVRIALGAEPGAVVRMVVVDVLRWALGGLAAGLPLALGVGVLLRSFLFGVRSVDIPTLTVASTVLMLAAATAAYAPARRVSRVDPIKALKNL